MNLKASIAVTVLGLVAGVGCGSGGDTPTVKTQSGAEITTTSSSTAAAAPTLTVDGLDQAGCDAYAAKQTRLNPGKTWTAKLNGSTCELTSH